ncbi:DUF6221 family protein [Kitasatospora sp. NPDC101235]|uniref:DUF6221 family protein n=1 Tax=Kitasatospora sp. NPDC101235 TaxID=3364101 RepID=UPI003820BC3F
MTDNLVTFLRARLDEDEQAARAATPGPWTVDSETYAAAIHGAGHADVIAGGRWGGEASVFESTEDALHIVRHDPPRVLAEVAAKRRILDQHRGLESMTGPNCSTCCIESWPCPTLRLLALPYANHPDYRPEWAPGA